MEKSVRDLDTKEVIVKFHSKVWPSENELLEREDGKKAIRLSYHRVIQEARYKDVERR